MIAFGEVIDALRRLGKEKAEQTAPGSLMVRNSGVPMCIVGHALVDLGVKIEQHDTRYDGEQLFVNGQVVGDASDTVSEMQWNLLGIRKPTPQQEWWAENVQRKQDDGMAWGDAIASADRFVDESKLVSA